MTRPFPRPPDPPIDTNVVIEAIRRMLAAQRARVRDYYAQIETPAIGVTIHWSTRSTPFLLVVHAPEGTRHQLLAAYRDAGHRAEIGPISGSLALIITP